MTNLTTLQPDLTNLNGKVLTATVKAGSTVIYSGSVKNQGSATAGSYVVEWWLSPNNVITTADKKLKSLNKSSLAQGATTSATTSVLIPATTTPGTYYLGVWVDRANAVKESNETNNKFVIKLTVTSNSTVKPDLYNVSGKLLATSVKAGGSIVFSGSMKNQGNGAAGAFDVEYWLSTNTTLTTTDKNSR